MQPLEELWRGLQPAPVCGARGRCGTSLTLTTSWQGWEHMAENQPSSHSRMIRPHLKLLRTTATPLPLLMGCHPIFYRFCGVDTSKKGLLT